jgi:type IV secretory pathway VirD2 relaxase
MNAVCSWQFSAPLRNANRVAISFTFDVRRAMSDEEFEPKLGRIANRPAPRERTYLQRVTRAIALAGGGSKAKPSKFTGERIGRGSGIGRILSSRGEHAHVRRVIVKMRIVRLAGKITAARTHLRYIQRDGVTRDGQPGQLYDRNMVNVDGKAFLERGEDDRHQFRFIVSAEDALQIQELKPFIRDLMTKMEFDLNTKLDWVAVDHFNTGHPHTHILLRGRADDGDDLIIAREYVSHGMRERASEVVSLELGPRTQLEVENKLRQEVTQDRFTSLDRDLLKDMGEDREVAHGDTSPFRQTLRAGRLQHLARCGLAEELKPGTWGLAEELEPTLRHMGERGDIIRTMQRELKRLGLERGGELAIYSTENGESGKLVGRVLSRGFTDELNDRYYLVIDGVDGRAHHVDIGAAETPVRTGDIVTVAPRPLRERAVDRTVAEVAAAHGGRYSVDNHLAHDPTATVEYAETHVRRLEAMRRTADLVEREPDGSWTIASDHVARAADYERRAIRLAPVTVEIVSSLSVDKQSCAPGATWLDHQLVSREPSAVRDAGFGKEVNDALARRRQWLLEQDLAREEQGQIVCRANLLSVLRRRDLTQAAGQLSNELGLTYAEAKPGDVVEGVYRRPIELTSGKFAIIEKAHEFSLVPWRPQLERALGRPGSGIVRSDGISWSALHRSGPEIS